MGCFTRERNKEKKNIDYWQKEVLEFLFLPGKPSSGRKVLKKVPLKRFGCRIIDDFVKEIPFLMVEPFLQFAKEAESKEEFQPGDLVIWHKKGKEEATEATFLRYISDTSAQHKARIKLKHRTICGSAKFIVPLVSILHFKEFLKSKLNFPSSTNKTRVTVIESRQQYSADVIEPSDQHATKSIQPPPKMNNCQENQEDCTGYEKGDYVWNKEKRKCARITNRSWPVQGSSPVIEFQFVNIINNAISETNPKQGGTETLRQFMADWDPYKINDLPGESSKNVENEEQMDCNEPQEENQPLIPNSNPVIDVGENFESGKKHRSLKSRSKVSEEARKKEKPYENNVREKRVNRRPKSQNEEDCTSNNIKKTTLGSQNEIDKPSSKDTNKYENEKILKSNEPEIDVRNRRNSQEDLLEKRQQREGENIEETQTVPKEEVQNKSRAILETNILVQDKNKPRQSSIKESSSSGRTKRIASSITPVVDSNVKLMNIQKLLSSQNREIIPEHRQYTTPTFECFNRAQNEDSKDNEKRRSKSELHSTDTLQSLVPTGSFSIKSSSGTGSDKLSAEKKTNGRKESQIEKLLASRSYVPLEGRGRFSEPNNFVQVQDSERLCGDRKGIQGRNNSCYLDSTLFSLYYCTDIFDKVTLYENIGDESRALQVRRILREHIVRPLRQNNYCSAENVNLLRNALAPLNNRVKGSLMDAEELIFLLFEDVLKMKEFIKYSTDTEDFMHQIVPNPSDNIKCQTVEILFQNSLKIVGDMTLADVPNPALFLEMPRSNGKLVQYEAIVPNLTLDISNLMDRKMCTCNNEVTSECSLCKIIHGKDAIAYCRNCEENALFLHQDIDHKPNLVQICRRSSIMHLMAVICIRFHHYTAFVRKGFEETSPWLFFDSMAGEYPEVTNVEDFGAQLAILERQPKYYIKAMNQNHYIRKILSDSHICIYHSPIISP